MILATLEAYSKAAHVEGNQACKIQFNTSVSNPAHSLTVVYTRLQPSHWQAGLSKGIMMIICGLLAAEWAEDWFQGLSKG